MFDVPKMLYGPRGWADLDDYRIVRDADEEAAAAQDGYFRAGEEAQEDLVAAGKWNSRPPPVVSGQPVEPRRRGRPPKDERR